MTVEKLKELINNIPDDYNKHEIFVDDTENEFYTLLSDIVYTPDSTLYKNVPGYMYLGIIRKY